MKPTKPGFYWYRDEPVKVELFKDLRGVSNEDLVARKIGTLEMLWVYASDASDWGPEIKKEDRDET